MAGTFRSGHGCKPDECRNAAGPGILVRTDAQGRDIYSRVLYGARISLTVGVLSQMINTVIGVCLGVSAGYWGGGGTILSPA